MIKKDTRFLIVGLGLIGGSYAMGLKRNGFHVDAIDINQLSIDYAKEHDIIDEGSTFAIELIQNADFIISGLYPNMTVEWYPSSISACVPMRMSHVPPSNSEAISVRSFLRVEPATTNQR